MAKRSSRSSSKSGGSTVYGLLAGLLLGLIAAAVVAFYVTKAPVPFVDRATRTPPAITPPPTSSVIPDPNQALRGGALPLPGGGSPVTPPTASAPALPPAITSTAPPATATQPPASAPQPGRGGANGGSTPSGSGDELGALIASLPGQQPARSAAPSTTERGNASAYFLQIGSYQVLEDAEALRARILLLGLPVLIQRAEVNGLQVNRVRVGPFSRLDEMNRTRSRLEQEKINATVVRQ